MRNALELLSIIVLVICGSIGLSTIVNNLIYGVIILCCGSLIFFVLRKLSRYESYKKRTYDLMKEQLEIQKQLLNQKSNTGEDD
ncbi:MAG: hypothetical protein PUC65_08350 [Clostridiales bacterium]|nr:hypothetical protein [Clostridiales bacterium]